MTRRRSSPVLRWLQLAGMALALAIGGLALDGIGNLLILLGRAVGW